MRGCTGAVRRWGPVLLGVASLVTLMGFAALAAVPSVSLNTSPQIGDVFFNTATDVYVSASITVTSGTIDDVKVIVNGESFDFLSGCSGQGTSCSFYENINLTSGAGTCSANNTITVQAFQGSEMGSASGTQFPDYSPPAVNPTVNVPDINTGWYNMTSGPPNLTLTGDDANPKTWCQSGVSEIHYDVFHEDTGIDDGEQIVSGSVASLSLSQDGVYTITFWAVDAAGNSSVPPTKFSPYEAQAASSSGNSGSPWWQAMVRPGPGCSGGGGLAVPAQANSGPPATPVPDQFGGPSVCNFSVDLTPPDLQIINQSPAPNANGWNNTSPVAITVGCSDNLSSWYVGFGGPGFIVCNNQGLPYNQGDQVTAVISFSGEGQLSQTVTAMDAAGNTAQLSVSAKIDLTPPLITITPGSGTLDSGTIVSWSVSDALSGLASCSTSLGSSACSGSTPLTQSMTLTVNAVDLAGNQASASQKFQLNSPSPLILMIESGKARVGDEISLEVVLVEAPLGLRQYQLTIGTNQAGLVQFESVDNRVPVEDPLDFSSSVSEHGQSVTFSLVDSLDQVQAGAHQVVLATLHLRALKAGKLDLSPLAFSVLNDQGSKEQIIFLPGQLVIQPRGS
ncbi:MAG TPA: hypothetical protein ENI60_08845 [Candidatus Fraserbacteria bacterium]|nr:hypothetical protein [Candidatus Fraserbacteria bacterium]